MANRKRKAALASEPPPKRVRTQPQDIFRSGAKPTGRRPTTRSVTSAGAASLLGPYLANASGSAARQHCQAEIIAPPCSSRPVTQPCDCPSGNSDGCATYCPRHQPEKLARSQQLSNQNQRQPDDYFSGVLQPLDSQDGLMTDVQDAFGDSLAVQLQGGGPMAQSHDHAMADSQEGQAGDSHSTSSDDEAAELLPSRTPSSSSSGGMSSGSDRARLPPPCIHPDRSDSAPLIWLFPRGDCSPGLTEVVMPLYPSSRGSSSDHHGFRSPPTHNGQLHILSPSPLRPYVLVPQVLSAPAVSPAATPTPPPVLLQHDISDITSDDWIPSRHGPPPGPRLSFSQLSMLEVTPPWSPISSSQLSTPSGAGDLEEYVVDKSDDLNGGPTTANSSGHKAETGEAGWSGEDGAYCFSGRDVELGPGPSTGPQWATVATPEQTDSQTVGTGSPHHRDRIPRSSTSTNTLNSTGGSGGVSEIGRDTDRPPTETVVLDGASGSKESDPDSGRPRPPPNSKAECLNTAVVMSWSGGESVKGHTGPPRGIKRRLGCHNCYESQCPCDCHKGADPHFFGDSPEDEVDFGWGDGTIRERHGCYSLFLSSSPFIGDD